MAKIQHIENIYSVVFIV